MDTLIHVVDVIAREALLFAAAGMLVGGVDDLLVDLIFFVRRLRRARTPALRVDDLPAPERPGGLVVFVPAWEEAAVIGAMLRLTLARLDRPDLRILVGVYPNDAPTTDAALAVAAQDARVRVVTGPRPGPTTKADNLNVLWRALARDEATTGRRAKAVVLHDAEDVVHPAEGRVFDALIERHPVVQLPVLPLVERGARLVSGHYADEFAEAHTKLMVVRGAIGAGLPLAGTGCAIRTDVLARLAAARGGEPFDGDSLVEDYELGLRVAGMGERGLFARVGDGAGGLVAVRSFFPRKVGEAVRQKARWMVGIAFAGWDRTGWAARRMALTDHWMRMRDRRAPLAVLVLAAAYLALVAWGAGWLLHLGAGTEPARAAPGWLLAATMALLGWRAVMRALFTGRAYGWREATWSLPRMLVGNLIALLAARAAVWRYLGMLRGAAPGWDKTTHRFPGVPHDASGAMP